jgi:hypothetical protein
VSVAMVKAVSLEGCETFYTCSNTRIQLPKNSIFELICLQSHNDEMFTTQYMFQDVRHLLVRNKTQLPFPAKSHRVTEWHNG